MRVVTALALGVSFGVSMPTLAQTAAEQANPISRAIAQVWNRAKQNVLKSAEQMPEDAFAFKPVDTVRTFGQIIAHVAGDNYVDCSHAKQEKSPFTSEHFEKTAKTKAEIVKALRDSIAYCDEAYAGMTDVKAAEVVPVFNRPMARAAALIINNGHVEEHYGNLVTYMRIKGMVPPSSQGRQS